MDRIFIILNTYKMYEKHISTPFCGLSLKDSQGKKKAVDTFGDFFRKKRMLGLMLSTLFLISVLSYVNPQTQTEGASDLESAISAEPLVKQDDAVSRTISHPLLWFDEEPDEFITQTITWYPNGTVHLYDDKGSSLIFAIDSGTASEYVLQANSQVVGQKVKGDGFEYDIFWRPVEDSKGFVNKYKFDIIGNSENGMIIKFFIRTDEQMIRFHGNSVIGISPVFHSENATIPQGIGIDWSDAISEGYTMSFDSDSRTVNLPVGKSFSVDPTTIDTITVQLSPGSTDYYEGEKRLIKVGSTLFLFYYDSSNIAYRYSTNNGDSWSSKLSTQTGALNNEYYRFNVVSWKYSGADRITLLYWILAASGIDTDFKAKTFSVSGTTLNTLFTKTLFTTPNSSTCGGGVCPAAAGAASTSGTIYVALRYYKPSVPDGYYYRIYKSTNGGNTWPISLSEADPLSDTRIPIVLSDLAVGNMLFAYAHFNTAQINYRTIPGASWTAESTTTGTGMGTNTVKQISVATDTNKEAHVAYLTSGISGNLRVYDWSLGGSFLSSRLVDSTKSHTLPSSVLSQVGSYSFHHIYTITGGEVWDNRLLPNGSWNTWRGYAGFNNPDLLASAAGYRGNVWMEGNTIKFGIDDPDHDDDELGLEKWSRLTADGHRNELKCQASPNNDKCKVPYYVDNSMAAIMPISGVKQEAGLAAGTLNAFTPYIGLSEEVSTFFWDNALEAEILPDDVTARVLTPWGSHNCPLACHGHLTQTIVQVNADTEAFPWGTFEAPECDFGETPAVYDIQKTILHEFFHALSFDHADSNDLHSILATGYACDTRTLPTDQDVEVVLKKYPAGVT